MVGFVMLVGPGESEIAIDSLSRVLTIYPDAFIWIRDDNTQDGTYQALQDFASLAPEKIILERNDAPRGYFGVAVSMFQLFERLSTRFPNLEMVAQLDPDACVLRPGIFELARERFEQFGPGMIGPYMRSASGNTRSHVPWRNAFIKDLVPLGFDRESGKLRWALPFYRKYLWRALLRGYKLGHHVLASFYLLHGDTIRLLHKNGFWASIPINGSRNVKGDDPLISLGVVSVGHRLIDLNEEGSNRYPTWVQFRPPLPLTALEIVQKGILVVHPLKSDSVSREVRKELTFLLGR
jgi:hypothetical protein